MWILISRLTGFVAASARPDHAECGVHGQCVTPQYRRANEVVWCNCRRRCVVDGRYYEAGSAPLAVKIIRKCRTRVQAVESRAQ